MPVSTDLCNRALLEVGGARIDSLEDESAEASACREHYEPAVKELLEGHDWNFATKYQKLAQSATAPTAQWQLAYALPSDCLKILMVLPSQFSEREIPHEVETGKRILADATEVWLKFIVALTDVNQYPPSFQKAVVLDLAVKLAVPLAHSSALAERLEARARRALVSAKFIDAKQNPAPKRPESAWTAVRGGGRTVSWNQ